MTQIGDGKPGGAPGDTLARQRLLDAAIEVYATVGTRGATTRRIAELARVNEITLFRHFGSKAQLLDEALRRAAEHPGPPELPKEPRDAGHELTRWAWAWSQVIEAERSLCLTCFAERSTRPGADEFLRLRVRRMERTLIRYLESLKQAGLARPDLQPATATWMLLGTVVIDGLVRDLQPDMRAQPSRAVIAAYIELFLRVICPI